MMLGTREVIREAHPYFGKVGRIPARVAVPETGEPAGTHAPNRRREVRVAEQRLCTYELCESIDEHAVVIQHGEVYSLNRSASGILVLMGSRSQTHRLLELHIPESRWRRSLNLYEVQWTKPVHVDDHGDLFLVGCRLTFGPSRYWTF